MELPSLSIVNDEELMDEALAILDSVDIERLGASAPEPALTLPEEEATQQDAADDLLKTAIQAVHAAYPEHGEPHDNFKSHSKSFESKSRVPEQPDKAATTCQDGNNQQEADGGSSLPMPVRGPLRIYTTVVEKQAPRPRSGGGRTRMREQLIQLRSVVQKMEHHLETLRSPRSPRFTEFLEDNEADEKGSKRAADDISGDAAVWRNIAMQQFHARRKAEKQNAELRESLEAQIQLSKQVEDLIQAHQTDPVSFLRM
ncbi:hypothetical protein PHYSODRAFT_299877 [Phytophthora sojae]|uniref:Uncharacterized protein n=1 Tax=Phytophthora sojae (strain P6497) TaxID=1094619 RepID=G4ZBD3_PHYSP|nr:hypothetical protein PHYSODRAFT_299877 [Phytophthora sojae]EGZ22729.1 hypothetical protein PHYSODRAFT_299877 [Phytophthora sojae]|eukprot:XP_009525446.1 hypothetical protein PHYSODRAFT_299877 [Phytophthora sojae]